MLYIKTLCLIPKLIFRYEAQCFCIKHKIMMLFVHIRHNAQCEIFLQIFWSQKELVKWSGIEVWKRGLTNFKIRNKFQPTYSLGLFWYPGWMGSSSSLMDHTFAALTYRDANYLFGNIWHSSKVYFLHETAEIIVFINYISK